MNHRKHHFFEHPILVGTMVCLLVVMVIVGVSYRILTLRLAKANFNNTSSAKEYQMHYGFIAADYQDSYWDSVYEAARDAGEEKGIYVEYIGKNIATDYSVSECMDIAIASKVDGILLSTDGVDVCDEIEEAKQQGIPVVTMLAGSSKGIETSFVGVNSYELGQKFGNQVAKILTKKVKKVCVLLNDKETTLTQKMVVREIRKKNVEVSTAMLSGTGRFEAEKVIRDLLLDEKKRPDILVCLSASDTTYASQSVIDYNKVGQVQIIGSYVNSEIEDAIEKGIVASAITVKSKELGEAALKACKDWLDTKSVNEYQTIPCYVQEK